MTKQQRAARLAMRRKHQRWGFLPPDRTPKGIVLQVLAIAPLAPLIYVIVVGDSWPWWATVLAVVSAVAAVLIVRQTHAWMNEQIETGAS